MCQINARCRATMRQRRWQPESHRPWVDGSSCCCLCIVKLKHSLRALHTHNHTLAPPADIKAPHKMAHYELFMLHLLCLLQCCRRKSERDALQPTPIQQVKQYLNFSLSIVGQMLKIHTMCRPMPTYFMR